MQAEPTPRRDASWRARAAALALIVTPVIAGLVWLAIPKERTSIDPVRGLVLGLGPAQARDRLRVDRPGSFRSSATEEDFALEWTPEEPGGEIASARLEFHLGQLVAVRLALSPDAPDAAGPPRTITAASLLTREPRGAVVELTWLARSCPTHAAEVARRMAAP